MSFDNPTFIRGTVLKAVLALLLVSVCSQIASAQTYLYNRTDLITGNVPSAVSAADFNGDGKLDVAVVNQADGTVSILLSKLNGTYAPKVDYKAGISPAGLVAADFNGDGKLDLAVASANCTTFPCSAGTVSVLLGNGDGTFAEHVD